MEMFFYSKTQLVFPGVSAHVYSNMRMGQEFFTTQFGLMLPSTPLAFSLLRFLRLYGQEGVKTSDIVPPADKNLAIPYLSNRGEMEVASCNKDLVLFVADLPEPVGDEWIVCVLGGNTVSTAIEDAIRDKDWQEAASWIDEHTGIRFQQPVCVDRIAWKQERKGGPMIPSMLLSEFYHDNV